jgi:hypothetical protein
MTAEEIIVGLSGLPIDTAENHLKAITGNGVSVFIDNYSEDALLSIADDEASISISSDDSALSTSSDDATISIDSNDSTISITDDEAQLCL